MMRIGICGAESTGKTTLARALAERFGLPLITERAREVARKLGIEDLNREYPQETWEAFQWECLWAQLEAEKCGAFVSDRTVIDNLAYWLVDRANALNSEGTYVYWRRVEEHLKQGPYDLLVFVRPDGIGVEDDGFRHRDPYHRLVIDCTLQALFAWVKSLGPSFTVVRVSGGTIQRVERVMEAVERFGRRRHIV